MNSARFRILSTIIVFVITTAIIPVALAGFLATGIQGFTSNGTNFVTIPDGTASGGISHDLDPNSWFAFRVHVKHADADHPEIGWWSDSFAPTSANIQICDVTGCEANSINAGTQSLDWSDTSKITIELQYKSCQLCTWNSQLVSF